MTTATFINSLLDSIRAGRLQIKPHKTLELPTKEDKKTEMKEINLKSLQGVDF